MTFDERSQSTVWTGYGKTIHCTGGGGKYMTGEAFLDVLVVLQEPAMKDAYVDFHATVDFHANIDLY